MTEPTFYSAPVQKVMNVIYKELPKQENPFLYLIELENMIEQTRLHMKRIAKHQNDLPAQEDLHEFDEFEEVRGRE